jgi:hypothetical protein
MKKLILGITVLALILFASSSMAAGPKVPKNLCLRHVTNTSHYDHLAFKSIGSVPSSGGTVKMYTINGFAYVNYSGPVHGTGYVTPGTTILHATYSGQGNSSTYRQKSLELFYDLVTNTGTLYYTYFTADGSGGTLLGSEGVVQSDCTTSSIPSAMVANGVDIPELE